MPDARLDLLLRTLDQAFDRRSWHGSNLMGALRGVDAEAAAWRPAAGRHSIWELAVHAAYWKYRVYRLLTDAPPRAFDEPGSDWFARPSEMGSWPEDVERLQAWHGRLREAIASFDPEALETRPGKSWYTYLDLIAGAAAHDLHHTGQIQLLKRLRTAGA